MNEFVKRARAAKIHALIIGHLKKEMPVLIGKAKAQETLIENLEIEFKKVIAYACFELAYTEAEILVLSSIFVANT